MVSRVPLLGMVVAVALLIGENLGANAYVVAKQRTADHQAALDQQKQKASSRAELDRLAEEARRIDAMIHGEGPPSRRALEEVETARRELEVARRELVTARRQAERDRLQVDRR